jgi:hypothetical protein
MFFRKRKYDDAHNQTLLIITVLASTYNNHAPKSTINKRAVVQTTILLGNTN